MKLLTLIPVILLVCFAVSCKSPKVITETVTVRETVTETVHDTSIVVQPDASTIRALLECDEERNVLVKQLLDVQTGSHVKPPVLDITDNVLTAECEVDSFHVYMTWKERFAERDTVKHTVLPPTVIKEPSGWQWFQIWLGRIAVVVAMVFGAIKLKIFV